MKFCQNCNGVYPEGAPITDACMPCVERTNRMHRNCQRVFNLIATIFSIVAVQQLVAELLGR